MLSRERVRFSNELAHSIVTLMAVFALGPHPVAHSHASLTDDPGNAVWLAQHVDLCHRGDADEADGVHFHWEFPTTCPIPGSAGVWVVGAMPVLEGGVGVQPDRLAPEGVLVLDASWCTVGSGRLPEHRSPTVAGPLFPHLGDATGRLLCVALCSLQC
ncbi:MAG: hypothetical protein KatS3mg111_0449 [Pirellulaceae bacterium]|nr:MAG: hypothetical protein KatS3mg111_0449 [Pirellulaceae bacterium]